MNENCGIINLTPHLTCKASSSKFYDINTLFHKKSNELAQNYFSDASQRLILHTIAKNIGYIEVVNEDKVRAKVGVTVDETDYILPK